MDGSRFAWTTYMNGPEFRDVLLALRDTLGCEVVPKDDLDANYIIDLDIDTDAERKAGA